MRYGNKIPLVIMTFTLLIGFFIAINVWKNKVDNLAGCYVNNKHYKVNEEFENNENDRVETCVCEENGKVACKAQATNKNKNDTDIIDIDQYTRSGLTFSASLINRVSAEVLRNSDVEISEVKTENGYFKIHVIENQYCNKAGKIVKQVGFYYYDKENSALYLTSMLNNSQMDANSGICRTDLYFNILGFVPPSPSLTVKFVRDNKVFTAKLCVYNKNIYKDGDAFQAVDGCNICTCTDGNVSCENKKECSSNKDSKKIESAYKNFPDFDRYEKPEKDGECSKDSQCYVSGCNNEVCSATKDVKTTCEVVQKIEDASCKCVNKKCIWVK